MTSGATPASIIASSQRSPLAMRLFFVIINDHVETADFWFRTALELTKQPLLGTCNIACTNTRRDNLVIGDYLLVVHVCGINAHVIQRCRWPRIFSTRLGS